MTDAVHIRPARHEDFDCLVSLLGELFSIEEDFVVDEARQRRGLAMMPNNGRGRIIIAERSQAENAPGPVIGLCTGQITVSTAEGGPAVLIEDVVVSKDWRGRGLGPKLMNGITDWARENEATRLQLQADTENTPALGLYERLGWEPTQLTCLRSRL